MTCVPWPGAVTAPAIVQYGPEIVVRCQCDGFVRAVHAEGGTHVRKGQLLLQMENALLEDELVDLQLQIEKSRIQRRACQQHRELAKAQAELKKLRTLEQQLQSKREEVAALEVRAPCSGKVVGRHLDALEGTYQTKGSRLLSIGDESAKEISLSIAQQDTADFRRYTNMPMRVLFTNAQPLDAPLESVEPRASVVPLSPSLCAPLGGSLAVRSIPGESSVHEQQYELLSPRFSGTIRLTAAQSRQVHAGQRGRVVLRGSETVGQYFYHRAAQWVNTKLHRRQYRLSAADGH